MNRSTPSRLRDPVCCLAEPLIATVGLCKEPIPESTLLPEILNADQGSVPFTYASELPSWVISFF